MKSYEHSASFSKLKNITERISKNLTTLEYLHTLDMFLWKALAPIHAECPSLFQNYVAKIVARQTRKASRRFTSDDRTKLPIHLFNMVTTKDPKKAHEHARAMHLNRGLMFGFIALFFRRVEQYEHLHTALDLDPIVRNSKIYEIERSIGLRPGAALFTAVQEARFWYTKARNFKNMILEKYTRLALMHAKTTYKDFNHHVRLDDVIQIYMIVVSRAIDRCDARQGVLTTFITNWFKSARSEVAEMAKDQGDQSYEALVEEMGDASSEILGSTDGGLGDDMHDHIAYVAKQIDKQGYVRAALHIPERLSKKQLQILEAFVLEE
ncbi:RNA polymerase [Burkholderia phage BcepSauron]|uniref:RNA polymerase n=2 Tax=Sarumanvirus TaxID=2843450 RepID=A0A482MND8_9CAUD|nr:RNA polymerase sigma factor [Burkholderia phage BcepSaruman]YP_009904618.1 RNA polymerase sigma factor [Burkholderia phage BcepSauron]QBQ74620.1 RNA polymerase [Burkholderia phage BcepSauron]QBX06652.1 hypothetical protein BcepSaruman_239 [Burkholderia phage BcepSaruman]